MAPAAPATPPTPRRVAPAAESPLTQEAEERRKKELSVTRGSQHGWLTSAEKRGGRTHRIDDDELDDELGVPASESEC